MVRPFASPGDLPDTGIEPASLRLGLQVACYIAVIFFAAEPPGKPHIYSVSSMYVCVGGVYYTIYYRTHLLILIFQGTVQIISSSKLGRDNQCDWQVDSM